jgi:protein-S-isoprenylcysteine O-methyltransferase Ste14
LKILGKSALRPFVFYSGKISMIITCIAAVIQLIYPLRMLQISFFIEVICYALYLLGGVIVLYSSINLGSSLRVGLPKEKTNLNSKGVYTLTRNPIYIGVYAMILSSILFTSNIFVVLLGLYSIIIHHKIILSEEEFLLKRFGKPYAEYMKKVPRYFW